MMSILLFLSAILFPQEFPKFDPDKSDLSKAKVVFNQINERFDYAIIRYIDGYWISTINYEVIGFQNGKAKKILIQENKESKKFRTRKLRINKKDHCNYFALLTELEEIGFYDMKNYFLNGKGRRGNGDGTYSSINIYDCETYYFLIIQSDNFKSIYSYCPREYLKHFPEMTYRKAFLDCNDLFDNYWKK